MTMATLQAVGALGEAHQFPDEVDLDHIRAMRPQGFQPRMEWAHLVRELEHDQDSELREALVEVLERPTSPYPGRPERDDTPDFRGRHASLIISVERDRRPWPPPQPFAAPPGVGLVRAVDERAGRHVYGLGRVPPGSLAGELGSLPRQPAETLEPVWITTGGYLVTEAAGGGPTPRSLPSTIRWAFAPLGWRDADVPLSERARGVVHRLRSLVGPREERSVAPIAVVAYLHRSPQPGRQPLHSAFHPVTGDQLLTTAESEAADMGYGPATLLGYVDEVAPVTGTLEVARPVVPWASRFGRRIRPG
jgi:hypothetical protein